MGISRLRRDGWLDNNPEEVALPEFSEADVATLKAGKEVVVEDARGWFLIYLLNGVLVVRHFGR